MVFVHKGVTRKSQKLARRVPILIVEDNPDQWLIIRETFARCFPEVELIWINHPAQVLPYLEKVASIKANLPRLVLVDLFLPSREEGFSLLKSIKSYPLYRQIPVVVLSHSQDADDIDKAYRLNIASYIIKPVSFHEWLTCVAIFRNYWWEACLLPLLPIQAAGYTDNRGPGLKRSGITYP